MELNITNDRCPQSEQHIVYVNIERMTKAISEGDEYQIEYQKTREKNKKQYVEGVGKRSRSRIVTC